MQVHVIPEFKFCCMHAANLMLFVSKHLLVSEWFSLYLVVAFQSLAFKFQCFDYTVAQINKLYLFMKPWKTNQGISCLSNTEHSSFILQTRFCFVFKYLRNTGDLLSQPMPARYYHIIHYNNPQLVSCLCYL